MLFAMRWSRLIMRSTQCEADSAVLLAGRQSKNIESHAGKIGTNGNSNGPASNSRERQETNIESRLENLGDRLAQRTDAPFFALMHDPESSDTATDSLRDASERLTAEASALRWVLRIAKHSEGPVRARLWLDIDRALAALENLELHILRVQEDAQSIHVDRSHPIRADLHSRHH